MNAAAIILAAGESRRMGTPKASLPFRGGTFLSVLSGVFLPHCSPVVAVFGFDGDRLRETAGSDVIAVVNRNYEEGMLTSLKAGLRALPPDRDSIVFTLVDHPAVSADTVSRLLASRASIAIPRYRGKRGHPVRISRDIAREFLNEPSSSKVRNVIDRHGALIDYLDVDDCGVVDDIDDPELYRALLDREAAVEFR